MFVLLFGPQRLPLLIELSSLFRQLLRFRREASKDGLGSWREAQHRILRIKGCSQKGTIYLQSRFSWSRKGLPEYTSCSYCQGKTTEYLVLAPKHKQCSWSTEGSCSAQGESRQREMEKPRFPERQRLALGIGAQQQCMY